MRPATDVLVLGAGPAGCAAALRARLAGLSVTVLEARKTPQVAPGETLHPGAEPLLAQLGMREALLSAGFHRHEGVWWRAHQDEAPRFVPYGEDLNGPWRGFQADRMALQALMQDAVRDAGATLVTGAPLEKALVGANGQVLGVVAHGHPHLASWTLDATGHRAWLAEALGLPVTLRSPPLGVRFGWSHASGKHPGAVSGQPSFTFTPQGWLWRAPLAPGRHAWAELAIGQSADACPPGRDVTWRLRLPCAGAGYVLLGDSAAVLDPSSSHGVMRALMSGIQASHWIAAWRHQGLAAAAVARAHRHWTLERFEHDAQALQHFYLEGEAGPRFSAACAAMTAAP